MRFAASGDVFEGLFDRGGVRGAGRLATRAGEVVEGHFEGALAEPRLQVTLTPTLTLTLTVTLTLTLTLPLIPALTLILTLTRGVACCAASRASGTRGRSSSVRATAAARPSCVRATGRRKVPLDTEADGRRRTGAMSWGVGWPTKPRRAAATSGSGIF